MTVSHRAACRASPSAAPVMQAPQNVQAPPTPGIEFRQLIGAEDGCPSAVLFRQVATPNYELRSFLRASRRLGLRPVILTYHQDRMSHRNLFKRSLVAPMFIEGTNRLSQPIWRRRPVINVETVEKVRLAEIVMGDTQLTALPSASLEPPADQKPRVGYRNLTGSPVLVVADALIGQPREHATHEAVDDRGHSSQVDAT